MGESDDSPPPLPPPMRNGTSHEGDRASGVVSGDYKVVFFIIGGMLVMFLIGIVILVVSVISDWQG